MLSALLSEGEAKMRKEKFTKVWMVLFALWFSAALFQIKAYAVNITPDVTVDQFDRWTGDNISGFLLGTVFWILRIVGVLIFMWGIYGLVTGKKDGDADSMNQAMVKLVFGCVFLTMPYILKALGVIVIA